MCVMNGCVFLQSILLIIMCPCCSCSYFHTPLFLLLPSPSSITYHAGRHCPSLLQFTSSCFSLCDTLHVCHSCRCTCIFISSHSFHSISRRLSVSPDRMKSVCKGNGIE